jgi:hypothetical protein
MLQLLFDLEYPHWMMMAGAIKPLQGGFRAPHGCIRLTLNELGLRGGKMTTEEEAIWKTLEEFGAVLAQAQAFNRAHNSILMEIVRDIARSQPDPHKYIADMFERISARADLRPIEREAHPVTVEFRDTIANFFSTAGKNLTK